MFPPLDIAELASLPAVDRFPVVLELGDVLPGSCVGFQRDDADPGPA